MKIKGISHITFICENINKSAKLFIELFDAIEVYSSEQKNFSISQEKFFLIGDLWIALMEGSPIERSYNHIAFSVDEADFSLLESKIRDLELTTLPSRPRDPREGKSIYFYDYDNHLFELHAGNLTTRLDYYNENSDNKTKPTYEDLKTMPKTGVEPATFALRMRCSTN